MPKLVFKQTDLTLEIPSGSECTEIKEKYPGCPFKFGCKRGMCGTCTIKVLEGADSLSQLTKEEEHLLKYDKIQQGYRLACQCAINDSVTFDA